MVPQEEVRLPAIPTRDHGEIRIESDDGAAGCFTTRSDADPTVSAQS
jgi:hypothetical protein